MSIEIDVLNGDQSWPLAEPLMKAVWPQEVLDKLSWGHIRFAHADLRVLIEQPEGGLVCHVGIHFRTVIWNGRKFHIGGVGGVATRADRAMPASRSTLRYKPSATTKPSISRCCSASRTILHFMNRAAGIPSQVKSTPNSPKVAFGSRR